MRKLEWERIKGGGARSTDGRFEIKPWKYRKYRFWLRDDTFKLPETPFVTLRDAKDAALMQLCVEQLEADKKAA